MYESQLLGCCLAIICAPKKKIVEEITFIQKYWIHIVSSKDETNPKRSLKVAISLN